MYMCAVTYASYVPSPEALLQYAPRREAPKFLIIMITNMLDISNTVPLILIITLSLILSLMIPKPVTNIHIPQLCRAQRSLCAPFVL